MSFIKNVKGVKDNVTKVIPVTSVPTTEASSVIQKKSKVEEETQTTKKTKKQTRMKIEAIVPEELKENEVISKMYAKLGGTIQIKNYNGNQCTKFEEICSNHDLIRAIYGVMNWQFPSPIQSFGTKPVKEGLDLICQSQAGTGKTGTYMVAALELVDQSIRDCQIIVLSPTRELTIQTFEVSQKLATYMDVSIACHIGRQNQDDVDGKKYPNNKPSHLPYHEQIVIATPGKLNKLLKDRLINPSNIKLIIIDEADKMLQHGFMDSFVSIFSEMPQKQTDKGVQDVQVALYSATWNDEIRNLSIKFMSNPVTILVDQEDVIQSNQKQYRVDVKTSDDKDKVLLNLFKFSNIGQVMIFCNRKTTVTYVTNLINSLNLSVGCIHSELSQDDRNMMMEKFRNGNIKILVATDVLARGIDTIVHLVINYDIPQDVEQYVHRIGRTGRFGKEGNALSIVSIEDRQKMIEIISSYKLELGNYDKFIEDNSNFNSNLQN